MDLNFLKKEGFAIESKAYENSKEIVDFLVKEGFQNTYNLQGGASCGVCYWVAPGTDVIECGLDPKYLPRYTLESFKEIITNQDLTLWI